MAFDVDKQERRLKKVCDCMEINDCDEPKPMKLSLYKVRDAVIEVEYALNEYDIDGPKKVQQIVLEYAMLAKSYSKLKKTKKVRRSRKKKKKRGKKKKGDEDEESEEEDDSDDSDESGSSDSDSDDDEKSEDEEEDEEDGDDMNIDHAIDDIDINSLKWIAVDKKIKYKKRRKRNKCKIEDLKENRAYLVRIRAKNSSGFGPWSQIISAVTPKSEVKFTRFDTRYIAVEKKGKRVRTNNNSCTYVGIFASKGFNSGVKRWKIKVVTRKHGSTEQVGIVQTVYEGTQCYGKQITSCGGIASGANLQNGDVVEIILDFKKGNVTFMKNKAQLKTQNISKGSTYYPAIHTCACAGQLFEVVR